MNRRLFRAISAQGLAGLVVYACSLPVDESLVGRRSSTGDGGDGADASPTVVTSCAKDADCSSSDGCVVGKCDATSHTCGYQVCPTGDPCSVVACNAQTHKCEGQKRPFGFHAGSFALPDGLACVGCAVAVAPYLFAMTTNAVVVARVLDPTDPLPSITTLPLPFTPLQIARVGQRVFFVGNQEGITSPRKVQIAWVDVSPDPSVAPRLRVDALDTPTAGTGRPDVYFGAPDTVYLASGNGILVEKVPTTTEEAALNYLPANGVPTDARYFAASGNRLLTVRRDTDSIANFSIQSAPGGVASRNGGETPLSAVGTVNSNGALAVGPDGSVLWLVEITPDAMTPMFSTVRASWILANAAATAFSGDEHVDVESYPSPRPFDNPGAGPVAFVDDNTAFVLTQARENAQQTSLQVLSRAPSPIHLTPQRFVVPARVSDLTATSSGNFGYVITPDTVNTSSVQVFAVGCGS